VGDWHLSNEGGSADLSLKPLRQLEGDLIHDVLVELALTVHISPVDVGKNFHFMHDYSLRIVLF
jgi:hypothetical protein